MEELEEIIPPTLMGEVNQDLLSHLKLNLAGLLYRVITEEMLDAIAKPFLNEVEKVQTAVLKESIEKIVLPCVVMLIILILFGMLCWTINRGQLSIMQEFVRRLLDGGTREKTEVG